MLTYNSLELYQIVLALMLLLSCSYAGHKLATSLHAPGFIGELGAGIFLGPSFLSFFFTRVPELFSSPGVQHALALIQELGLLLLMYDSGIKLSKKFMSGERKFILTLFGWGLTIPLCLGMVIGIYCHDLWSLPQVSVSLFGVFFGLSMAMTSIPVISKILSELGLLQSTFARIVISTAVLEDIVLFVILAMLFNLPFGFNFFSSTDLKLLGQWQYLQALGIPIIFLFLCWNAGIWGQKFSHTTKIFDHPWTQAIPFHLLLMSSVVLIGLSLNVPSFLGSFGAGLFAQHFRDKSISESERFALERFSMSFFIPIYFCMVGFKLNLRLYFSWPLFLTLLIVSVFSKVVAIAPFCGRRSHMRFDLVWALNAKGGPGIVMAALALTAGFISQSMATALVMLSLTSSLMAGFWLKRRRNQILQME